LIDHPVSLRSPKANACCNSSVKDGRLQFGAFKMCIAQVCARKIRKFQGRVIEASPVKVCCKEVRMSEVRPAEIRLAKIRMDENRLAKVRPVEIRPIELRHEENRPAKIHPAEVPLSEASAAQVNL